MPNLIGQPKAFALRTTRLGENTKGHALKAECISYWLIFKTDPRSRLTYLHVSRVVILIILKIMLLLIMQIFVKHFCCHYLEFILFYFRKIILSIITIECKLELLRFRCSSICKKKSLNMLYSKYFHNFWGFKAALPNNCLDRQWVYCNRLN